MNKGLFFMLLSLICFYIVLDEIYGNKMITKFTLAIIPSAEKSNIFG